MDKATRFTISIKPHQLETIKEAAAACHMTLSEYCRHVLLAATGQSELSKHLKRAQKS